MLDGLKDIIALSNELYKSICNHCHLRHCRRISRHDHYRGWPRILVHRNIEESLCKGWLGIEPRWDHREVAVIAELVVDREAEQTDEELLPLHHDRQSRCERHRPRALHDKVDLVHVEELAVDAWHRGRIVLIVVDDKFQLTIRQAAVSI